MTPDPPRDDPEERERCLDEAVAAFHRAREAGEDPDPDEWIARYPELAPDLADHFHMDGVVGWMADADLPRAPASGTRFGPYRVLRMIGRGGMGVVYEAEHAATGRRVALKVLPSCLLPDPRQAARFRREAAVVASLDHPHILRILDRGEHAGIPYFAMRRIEGASLRVLVGRLRHARGSKSKEDAPASVLGPSGPHTLGGPMPEHALAVAAIGLQAAEALAYAHSQGVIHRDIKPSNLLLDASGSVFVTDFGLAQGPDRDDLTETGDLAGTLRYLPPERLRGWADPRSDVYSLGLTLYELLTLRPAFDAPDRSRLLRAIAHDTPRRPRARDREIPRDLESIIRKAIEREPSHRYPSAAAMADDLRRFLDGVPVRARRVNVLRRAWSWTRRNKAKAAGMALAGVALVGMVAVAFVIQSERRRAAEASAEEARFEAKLLEIAGLRTGRRFQGWSAAAMEEARAAWAKRPDERLRDQAAASLAGLDLRAIPLRPGPGGGAVAFREDGHLLLSGGSEPGPNRDGRARLYDIRAGLVTHIATPAGPGPVAFTKGGKALQLLRTPASPKGSESAPRLVLSLWNVAEDRAEARFDAPDDEPTALALAADASLAAAAFDTGGRPMMRLWDGATGRHIRDLPGEATALAFSPDGQWLAAGDSRGFVHVRDLRDPERAIDLPATENRIQALCFCRDPWRDAEGRQGWLIGVGDAGAEIVTLDLTARRLRTRFLGSSYEVKALAFSADGTILASGGRQPPRLWDAATGECLLLARGHDETHGIAFSPGGDRLAISSRERGRVFLDMDEVDEGRGIATLRGLRGPISKVVFAPDGRRVAALSHDWRVGVWDLRDARLLAVLPGPRGGYADNAALAFRPDGKQIALASGETAQLWDLDPCGPVRPWKLPPGLSDALAFRSPNELFLCRLECKDGVHRPYHNDFPRVLTIRNLLGPRWELPLVEPPAYARLNASAATPDGDRFVLNLTLAGPDDSRRLLQSVDAATGEVLQSLEFVKSTEGGGLVMDPTGSFVLTETGQEDDYRYHQLLDLSDLRVMPTAPSFNAPSPPRALGPGASILACSDGSGHPLHVIRLHASDSSAALLRLGIDGGSHLHAMSFDRTGRRIAWGRADGLVHVADLIEIRGGLGSMAALNRIAREPSADGAVKAR